MIFDPRFWVAAALAIIAISATSYGVGWHYGDKGKVAMSEYQAVIESNVKLQTEKQAAIEQHAADKAALAPLTKAAEDKIKAKDVEIEKLTDQHRTDARTLLVANANLATARLVLGDTSEENRRLSAAVAKGSEGTPQSTDTAGGPDTCKPALMAVVQASITNNAELSRAIFRRDQCVEQYEKVQHRLNGD